MPKMTPEQLATKINKKVNIPILSEKTEQKIFYAIALAVFAIIDEAVDEALEIKE